MVAVYKKSSGGIVHQDQFDAVYNLACQKLAIGDNRPEIIIEPLQPTMSYAIVRSQNQVLIPEAFFNMQTSDKAREAVITRAIYLYNSFDFIEPYLPHNRTNAAFIGISAVLGLASAACFMNDQKGFGYAAALCSLLTLCLIPLRNSVAESEIYNRQCRADTFAFDVVGDARAVTSTIRKEEEFLHQELMLNARTIKVENHAKLMAVRAAAC